MEHGKQGGPGELTYHAGQRMGDPGGPQTTREGNVSCSNLPNDGAPRKRGKRGGGSSGKKMGKGY